MAGGMLRRTSSAHAHHHRAHPEGMPAFEGFHLWHRKWSNLGYAIFVLFCNLALPCILFYVLRNHTNLDDHMLIVISSVTLGVSSSFDGPFRTWKLWKDRPRYGPLNDPVKWHLDFTMHLYSFALFFFAIPLAVASSVRPPMKDFFNMSTTMFIAPIGLIFFITLFRPPAPFWISSDPAGTRMKPAVFYLFEDIGAVDFRFGREWRVKVNERYNASPPFQDLMWHLTAFWTLGTLIYFGIISAVVWTTTFGFAFGCVLGILFIFLTAWSGLSLVVVKWWGRKELRWWEECERAHGRREGRGGGLGLGGEELGDGSGGKEERRESLGSEMTFGGKFGTVGSESAVGSSAPVAPHEQAELAKQYTENVEVTRPAEAVTKDKVV